MKKIHLILGLSGLILVGCSSVKKASEITQEQLNQLNTEEASKTIKLLLKSKDEGDYKKVVAYYSSKKNKEKVTEVKDDAVDKFPNGYYASLRATSVMNAETNPEEKVRLLDDMKKRFPSKYMNSAYYSMVRFQVDNGNLNEAIGYQQAMEESNVFRYLALDVISGEAAKSDIDLDITDLLESELSKYNKNKETWGNQAWNKDNQIFKRVKYNLAIAQFQQGNKAEAVNIIHELKSMSSDAFGSQNLNYATMLAKCEVYEEAVPVLEQAVIKGRPRTDTKYYLQKAYEAKGKSNFKVYYNGLMKEMNEDILSHVKEIVINEPAPKFVIKDVNGNEVTNKDLKGKTLVIDFWATWCGPCKASFPGMQAAANKFKDDESVMFLFVHTFEKSKNALEEAINYLKDNNYDFDLYMDYRNAETRSNQAAAAFEVRGIPTKVVIDPSGNLRFKVVGFKGGKDSMVAELSAMIDMAKGNQI
ncbi:TlpA disulfide reductase family protein [Aestuariibaculum sediminum]|uniref:TlpA family protein disulfide reductase n=1 Tax=Aestuariibaculum sediminum TaxID=2770637 RepID=A0A8J6PXA6_9FLAO|nr:TlpA disulfide reductase family protein [Aestuariibaculum sediminum]MBD0830542.1 TlpA family protein disulfide reductase [Aestuariibaculum sediminum]